MATKGANKAIILGHIGKDPEVRSDTITNISIATSETWKDKASGEMQERTEWHDVTFIGKLAEIAAKYLKKGSQVYIEGKIQTRKWQDKQGQDRYSTGIVVDSFGGVMQMLGSKNGGAGEQQQPSQQQPRHQAPQTQDEDFKDIPF